MPPQFSYDYSLDVARRYLKINGNGIHAFPRRHSTAYLSYLVISSFCGFNIRTASRFFKANGKCVFDIFRKCNPFQVSRIIVKFDPVFMVDSVLWRRRLAVKCEGDNSVNKHCACLHAIPNRTSFVSGAGKALRYQLTSLKSSRNPPAASERGSN